MQEIDQMDMLGFLKVRAFLFHMPILKTGFRSLLNIGV